MRFENKVALITGSSRGIGKATALLFAKEGARVIVNYSKSSKEANQVVEEIKKLGSEAIAVKCDVSKESKVKQMIEKALGSFGKIDILVNNAGIVFDTPFEKRTVRQWKRTLEVNLIGSFLCSKYAAQAMKKQKQGVIVNVSSTNAINSFGPESIDYDASKAGVILLTKDLAKELAPKIRVNCIAPGWVDTGMNKKLPKKFVNEETKRTFLKRFAKPEEIAKAILFLASDEASFITGSTLVADGGYQ